MRSASRLSHSQHSVEMAVYVISVVCVLVCAIYFKIKHIYSYWNRKGIKGPTPNLLIGNFKTVLEKKDSLHSLVAQFYNDYPDEKFVGIYQGLTPTLVIRDPSLVKRIVIKDFPSFINRGFKVTDEPLSRNLFVEDGDNWRILRQRLTPIFTSGKLKQMMPLMNNCVKHYMKYTNDLVKKQNLHELRDINAKYTLKSITSCAFGLDVDTFTLEGNTFNEIGGKMFERNMKRIIVSMIDSIFPGLPIMLHLSTVKPEVTAFFFNLVNTIIKEREGKPKVRKDFMDLMIDLKEQGTVTKVKEDGIAELEITDAVMAAQAVVFYAAGFETSSGAMSFLFYELALNPRIQENCYSEIKQVMEKYNGDLTYESLNELQYVSMAFDETLRKHPVASVLMRQSVTNYKFPDTDLTIEKGIKVLIPVIALHHDPKYYPNPEKFDPERFAPENKNNIHDCTYLPFGDGPRNCIGMRFAQVQSMLGIAHFLYNFRVEPSEKTPKQLTYDPQAITLASKDGIWLNITRR